MLHGKHFVLRTDHISLLTMRGQKEPHRRCARWMDELSEFEFTMEYLPGEANNVANAISRSSPRLDMEGSEQKGLGVQRAAAVEVAQCDPGQWLASWQADALGAAALLYLGIIQDDRVSSQERDAFEKYKKKFKLSEQFRKAYSYHDDRLWYKERVCLLYTSRCV